MKAFAIIVISVIFISCSAHEKNKNIENKTVLETSVAPVNICRLINDTNGKCYEKGISIVPIVKLRSAKIFKGEPLLGQAYYPTEYYNRLAECYKLRYKTTLSVSTIIKSIAAQSVNQDTVSFAINPDSLTIIKRGKIINEYELTIKLRSNFSNGVAACDTSGRVTTVRFFVRK